MSVPPKGVVIICLIQMLLIGAGFLFTRAFCGLYDENVVKAWGKYAMPMPGYVSFVRGDGLWFMLVPICWCLFAVMCARRDGGEVWLRGWYVMTGMLLTVGIGGLFLMSAVGAANLVSR